jgi:transposase-like protein
MAGGRPTAYDPSFCDIAIEAGKIGKSKVSIAAEIGVARNTLDNWAQQYPEFLRALTLAQEFSQDWWEEMGRTHLTEQYGEGASGDKMNTALYSRSMAARFPHDWRENSKLEHSGGVQIVVQRLSDAE